MLLTIIMVSVLFSGPAVSNGTVTKPAVFREAGMTEAILEEAREKLNQYFSSGDYRFDIAPRWIPKSLMQRDPRSIISVELRGAIQRYTDFEVLYRSRSGRERTDIQLAVKIEKKLPVLVRRISGHEVIAIEDLEEQWVLLARNSGQLMEDISAISGKKLRRTLLAGQPVRRSYLVRDYIIEAGDRVQVILEKKGIRVQLFGEAREHGAMGDTISIYSNETRKKYRAEVIRAGVTKWKKTL